MAKLDEIKKQVETLLSITEQQELKLYLEQIIQNRKKINNKIEYFKGDRGLSWKKLKHSLYLIPLLLLVVSVNLAEKGHILGTIGIAVGAFSLMLGIIFTLWTSVRDKIAIIYGISARKGKIIVVTYTVFALILTSMGTVMKKETEEMEKIGILWEQGDKEKAVNLYEKISENMIVENNKKIAYTRIVEYYSKTDVKKLGKYIKKAKEENVKLPEIEIELTKELESEAVELSVTAAKLSLKNKDCQVSLLSVDKIGKQGVIVKLILVHMGIFDVESYGFIVSLKYDGYWKVENIICERRQ